MKETVVFYPVPAIGQVVSMVELAKLISHHHPHLSLTILLTPMPSNTAISSYISHISQKTNNLPLSFHYLPSLSSPQAQQQVTPFDLFRLNVPNVIDFLDALSLASRVPALVTSAVQAAFHPTIPTYYFFSSCASALATFLYFPTLHSNMTESFKDLPDGTFFEIPGLPPIRASYFPKPLLNRNDHVYQEFLKIATSLPKSQGIIVNTFDSLEPRAIKAIANQECIPNGPTPPIYCIGPWTADASDRAVGIESSSLDTSCLSWLSEQPSRSVVFLCFGSKGAIFSESQMEEIAVGLESSGHRFLWVVPTKKSEFWLMPEAEGFLERTKERGLVVTDSWAPQADILRHESIGGFFTHCGWNSLVEAVTAGVPMVAWPLYSEQHLNSVILVEEMKLATAIDVSSSMSDGSGLVSRDEIELRVRQLLGSGEEREAVRKRSSEVSAMASAAWKLGGSSLAALSNLVGSWKTN